MIALLCAWACLFASYLVFAGSAGADEIVAGALCAGVATAWWVGIRRVSAHAFAFDAGAWAAAGRACRKLPWATLRVAAVLLRAPTRQHEGDISRRFFASGRRADARDGGRRAIGVLAASLAPDSFVLRAAVERDEIVVHALAAGHAPNDPRWPI